MKNLKSLGLLCWLFSMGSRIQIPSFLNLYRAYNPVIVAYTGGLSEEAQARISLAHVWAFIVHQNTEQKPEQYFSCTLYIHP